MKREEAMQILQLYKDELGQRIDKADAPDVKDVYQWQMDGFDMAIEALQAEPTNGRLIDADALMKELSDIQPYNWTESEAEIQEEADYSLFKSLINSAPTVQDDRPHGEWIEREDWNGDSYYDCSVCGESFVLFDGTPSMNLYHFCPNCGADMRGGDPE